MTSPRAIASATLSLLAALAIAVPAAAAPPRTAAPPKPEDNVAELPPPGLNQQEQEVLQRELEEEQWLEEQPIEPQQPVRPPAKQAPQAGAKQAPSAANPETIPEARKRTQTLRQVRGTVLGMKIVEVRGSGDENVVVLIKTDRGDRRLAIDLGPISQLERSELRIGGKLAAEGYVVAVRDQQFLVATRLKPENGTTLFITRPAQGRLERNGGPLPASDQPPLPASRGVPPLAPPDGLEREPLPPPQVTPPPQPSPRKSSNGATPSDKPRSLIEEQQRPGGS